MMFYWFIEVGPLNVIDQFSHDGIGWKTRVKFVMSHFDPFIVSQIVGFLVRGLLEVCLSVSFRSWISRL